MLALHVALDRVEEPTAGRGLGRPSRRLRHGRAVRAVVQRFPRPRRCAWCASTPSSAALAPSAWTGAIEAENAFQDGFPLLVASTASLAEVNRRLARAGAAAGDDGALSSQPRPRRPRRARRGPARRDRLRHRRGPGAAEARQAVRRAARSPTSTRRPACRPRGRRRARAVPRRPAPRRRAHVRHERGRRRRHRPHARAGMRGTASYAFA